MSTDGSSPNPGERPQQTPDPWGTPAGPPTATGPAGPGQPPAAPPEQGFPPVGSPYPSGAAYPPAASGYPAGAAYPPAAPGYPTGAAYPAGPGYPPGTVAYGLPRLPKEAYATWWQRVRAFLLDQLPTYIGLIVFYIGYGIGLARLYSTMASGSYPSSAGPMQMLLNPLVIIGWVLMLAGFCWNIWNRWLVGGKTGQSLGKRVLKIRLVSEQTGQPVGAGMAFLRDLCHILDGLAVYIGYLWPLWDEKRQTFSDKLMQTVVLPGAADSVSPGPSPAPQSAHGGYPGAG